MEDIKEYYKILGLEFGATFEEIRNAFKKKIFECHPDKGGSGEDAAKINKAYEILSDPTKRRNYDNNIDMLSDEQIIAKARDNVPKIFLTYLNNVRSRRDLMGKNVLRELKSGIRKDRDEIYRYLAFENSRLDAVVQLNGKFKKTKDDSESNMFDNVLGSFIREKERAIDVLKQEIEILNKMLEILAEYKYEKLMDDLKAIMNETKGK